MIGTETETADSGRFEPLAAAVATGSTVRAAAELCGIAERTAYRFSASREFRIRVAELRTEIASVAIGRLTAAVAAAVDTLAELLNSTNEPNIRLNSAKAILNSLAPLSDFGELRGRMDSLERGDEN